MTKKDVPDQNASIAVPLSLSVMMGRAMEREVASRAAAKVMIQILINASRKPLFGLKAGWKFSSGVAGMSGVCVGSSGRGEIGNGDGFSSMDEIEGEGEDMLLVGNDIVVEAKVKWKREMGKNGLSECLVTSNAR